MSILKRHSEGIATEKYLKEVGMEVVTASNGDEDGIAIDIREGFSVVIERFEGHLSVLIYDEREPDGDITNIIHLT